LNEFKRSDVKAGMQVKIVLKEDQRTSELTEGIVKDILTKSPKYPHRIKVRLVRRTPMEKPVKLDVLKKYWNEFYFLIR
jgi:uncharacterized repeat protein (TIGR03833 family)